jgi:mannitol-1-phosphate 5-dehydrogenase
MQKLAVIFGAGKTGRGFAAHLARLSGYQIVLVDKNQELISALEKEGEYTIQVLGNEELNISIHPLAVHHIEDKSWMESFVSAELVFTAVFGNNLSALAQNLAPSLQRRFRENPAKPLNFITCENFTGAATFLKEKILSYVPDEEQKSWLLQRVGFSASIILRTCLDASEDQSPLTIRAQNFFKLPCDGEAFVGNVPEVAGLKPLKNFENQLKRKIFTYNCINAVITYLGAGKGYTHLWEACNDPEILAVAYEAARETSEAQISEFGFDRHEQAAWTEAAFNKFGDRNLPDPITRNGADPARKLSRNDRLIGPALLALKHGIEPHGLLTGILAGFRFVDPNDGFSISSLIEKEGIGSALQKICHLNPHEPLFEKIENAYLNSIR